MAATTGSSTGSVYPVARESRGLAWSRRSVGVWCGCRCGCGWGWGVRCGWGFRPNPVKLVVAARWPTRRVGGIGWESPPAAPVVLTRVVPPLSGKRVAPGGAGGAVARSLTAPCWDAARSGGGEPIRRFVEVRHNEPADLNIGCPLRCGHQHLTQRTKGFLAMT